MSILDRIRNGFRSIFGTWDSGVYYQPLFTAEDVLKMDAAQLYREQPHLRTVVSFLARNVAQLGLHTFERVNETDRVRDRESVTAQLFRRPNPETTAYELVHSLVGDLALYDLAYWLLVGSASAPSGWELRRIPVPWVTPKEGDAFTYRTFEVLVPGQPTPEKVPAENMLVFHGWSPTSERDGTTPLQSLRLTLAEQLHALRYREAVWKRGGRVSSVITRPKGTSWSKEARDAFREDWRSKFTGNAGTEGGGTPILEDGMTIEKLDFSAHEQEFVEGTKLALVTVASVYHINPAMIGVLDNANYSNVREFRKMLYGDTLGPILAMVEDRLNTFLVPRLDPDADLYVEFNIAEKLQGNFEEQTAALQAAVGRPWMTADEARAKNNMPALGGDAEELVTPLNVLVGGQQSVADGETEGGGGGTTDELEAAQQEQEAAGGTHLHLVKARAPETYEKKYRQVLGAFFKRQRAAVISRLGAKSPGWWDESRWDAELAEDLYKLAVLVSTEIGRQTAKALGFPADDYDVDATLAFLQATTAKSAVRINAKTRDDIEARLETMSDDETAVEKAGEVFDVAEGSRTEGLAFGSVTAMSGFASAEAGKQVGASTKTWVVNSTNPRSAHAKLNGETVGIAETFSNGLLWPGDPAGDADDLAGCQCSLDIGTA